MFILRGGVPPLCIELLYVINIQLGGGPPLLRVPTPIVHCLRAGSPQLQIVFFTLKHRWVKNYLFVVGQNVKN